MGWASCDIKADSSAAFGFGMTRSIEQIRFLHRFGPSGDIFWALGVVAFAQRYSVGPLENNCATAEADLGWSSGRWIVKTIDALNLKEAVR